MTFFLLLMRRCLDWNLLYTCGECLLTPNPQYSRKPFHSGPLLIHEKTHALKYQPGHQMLSFQRLQFCRKHPRRFLLKRQSSQQLTKRRNHKYQPKPQRFWFRKVQRCSQSPRLVYLQQQACLHSTTSQESMTSYPSTLSVQPNHTQESSNCQEALAESISTGCRGWQGAFFVSLALNVFFLVSSDDWSGSPLSPRRKLQEIRNSHF